MKDTEGFNYEMAKGLSTHDPKQSEDLTSKLDFVAENEDRFNKLQGITPAAKPKTPSADKTGGLPQAALSALKQKPGEVVTFKNGQSWMMEPDGSVKQVR